METRPGSDTRRPTSETSKVEVFVNGQDEPVQMTLRQAFEQISEINTGRTSVGVVRALNGFITKDQLNRGYQLRKSDLANGIDRRSK